MIQLNSTTLLNQPTTVTETTKPIQTDLEAIDGSMSRNFIQDKYEATMVFSNLLPAAYQQVYGFATSSGVLNYYNNLSDYAGGVLTFNGLPTFKEVPYVRGTSMMRDITVIVRQV